MSWLEKTWEAGSTFVGEATGYYDIKRATTGVDPVTGEELTAAERAKHGALAAAGFLSPLSVGSDGQLKVVKRFIRQRKE